VFKSAFHDDINVFIKRSVERIENKYLIRNALNYLFEEAALMISYFVEKQYNYLLYPSNIPKSMAQSRSIFVSSEWPEYLHDLKIYFKKVQDTYIQANSSLDETATLSQAKKL
jgi:hypothetical protein